MFFKTALTACLVCLCLGSSSFAQDTPKTEKHWEMPAPPAGVVMEKDVTYLSKERKEKADLYLPAKRAKGTRSPAVLIIHGGGWYHGDKGREREFNIGTTLALHGYVGMSINYALSNRGKPAKDVVVTWPQNLHDCKTAVRWLRKNADRLHLDPDRIGVIGGSAGAHLAAMVAVTGPADGLDPKGPYGEFSARVRCAVDMYGPIDLMTHHDIGAFGKTRAEAPELYKKASPLSYLDKDDPPFLILHGTADTTVPLKQSELFAAALKKAGVEHQLVVIKGAKHMFDLQPKQRDLRPVVLAFFDKHLKPAK